VVVLSNNRYNELLKKRDKIAFEYDLYSSTSIAKEYIFLNDELKKTKNQLKKDKIIHELDCLRKSEILSNYLKYKNELEELNGNLIDLRIEMLYKKFSLCNHIMVYTTDPYENPDKLTDRSCACIKCGLDNSVLDRLKDSLSEEQLIMYNYLKNPYNYSANTLNTHIVCDLELGKNIYNEIIENNPNIDDNSLIELFKFKLENNKIIVLNKK